MGGDTGLPWFFGVGDGWGLALAGLTGGGVGLIIVAMLVGDGVSGGGLRFGEWLWGWLRGVI